MLRIEKNCINCYIRFFAHRDYTRYCSKKCRDEFTYQKKKYAKIYCKNCNNLFMPKQSNQIYCSKTCSEIKIKEYFEERIKVTDFKIFERDRFTCIYCGKSSIIDRVKLVIDHVYPRKGGGKNDLFNLVTSCEKCNGYKGAKILNKKIILSIMERNNDLNSCFNKNDYNRLVSNFNKKYK